MATQTFSSIVSKVAIRRTSVNPVVSAVTCRYAHQSGSGSHPHQDAANAAKRGVDEALRSGENLKNKAASMTEDIASNAQETAQSIAEKAKQAAQGAWESAKETAQKTKETVLGKADEAKETVKETANHHINTKNHPK